MFDPSTLSCVADIPRQQGRERPNAVALWLNGETVTYGALDEMSNRCAQALIAWGIEPGDRVAVLAKNSLDFFPLWLGVLKARACLAPINWRLAAPEVATILNDSGARLILVGEDFATLVESVAGQCDALNAVVQFEAGHERWSSFRDWISGFSAEDPNLATSPEDDVVQLYTSGTTGLPKGVMLSEANYAALFEGALAAGWARYEAGKTNLLVMPLFHVAGVNCGLIGLMQGARTVITRDVNPAEILALMTKEQVAYAFLAPTIINMVLQTPGVEEVNFSALEKIFYGASPIAEDVLLRAGARFGCTFTQLYGLTETIGGGAYLPPEDHDPAKGRLRACGKPWPNFEMRIITPDGRTGEPGEVGEMQIRSRGVMKRYWNRPDATTEAIDADGWFKSGDAGYIDADGYFYIHDRVKDMIVTGGENVYPAEVENALFGHPAVADAAVIGVPDARWGEAVKAIIVLKPGAAPDEAGIIAHCKAKIAGFKVPKSVDVVEALPRNPSGKVLRRELREPYWAGMERRVG